MDIRILMKIVLGVLMIYQLGFWIKDGIKRAFNSVDRNIVSRSFDWTITYFIGQLILVLYLTASGILFGRFIWTGLYLISILFLPFTVIRVTKALRSYKFSPEKIDLFNIFEVLFISVLSIYAFAYAFYNPLEAWDARSYWFFRAKGLFYLNTISPDFLKNYSYDSYPLFLPLITVFFSKMTGAWSEVYSKSYLFFNMLGYIVIISALLKNLKVRFLIRMLFLSNFVFAFQYRAVNGYADIHMALFFIMGYFLALLYMKNIRSEKNHFLLLLSTLFLSSSGLIKNEGMVFSLFFFFVVFIYTFLKKRRDILPLTLNFSVFLLIIGHWAVFCKIHGLHNLLGGVNVFIKYSLSDMLFNRLPIILKTFFALINLFHFIYFVFPIALILLFLKKVKFDFFQKFNAFFIIFFILIIMGVYLNTPLGLQYHLDSSLDRVLFVPYLLLLLFNSVFISKLFKPEIEKRV